MRRIPILALVVVMAFSTVAFPVASFAQQGTSTGTPTATTGTGTPTSDTTTPEATGTTSPGTDDAGSGATGAATGAGGLSGNLPEPSDTVRQSFDLLGADVENSEGRKIGEIDNLLVVPSTGDIPFALITAGGFLGLGEKLVPIPFNAMQYDTERGVFILDVDASMLRTAPTLGRYAAPNTRELLRNSELRSFWSELGIGGATGAGGATGGDAGTATSTPAAGGATGTATPAAGETSVTSTPVATTSGATSGSGSVPTSSVATPRATGTTGTAGSGASGAADTTPSASDAITGTDVMTGTATAGSAATGTGTTTGTGGMVQVGSLSKMMQGEQGEEDLVRITELGDFAIVDCQTDTTGTGGAATGTATETAGTSTPELDTTGTGTPAADATGTVTSTTGTATTGTPVAGTGTPATSTGTAARGTGTPTPGADMTASAPITGTGTVTGTATTESGASGASATGTVTATGTTTGTTGTDTTLDLDEEATANRLGRVEELLIDVEAARVLYVLASMDTALLGAGTGTPGTGAMETGTPVVGGAETDVAGTGTPAADTGTGTPTGGTGTGTPTTDAETTGTPETGTGTPSPMATGTVTGTATTTAGGGTTGSGAAATGTGIPAATGTSAVAEDTTGTATPGAATGATDTGTTDTGTGMAGAGTDANATGGRMLLIPWQALELDLVDNQFCLQIPASELADAPFIDEFQATDFSQGGWDADVRTFWTGAMAAATGTGAPSGAGTTGTATPDTGAAGTATPPAGGGTGTPGAAGGTTRTTGRNLATEAGVVMQASAIMGTDINNPLGETLGKMSDFLFASDDGTVLYGVISYGGFLGLGGRRVAVPWTALRFDPATEKFVLDSSQEQLDNAPALPSDQAFRSPGWDAQLQDYWRSQGQEVPESTGGAATGAGSSTEMTGTTGTDTTPAAGSAVTGTTGTNNTPSASSAVTGTNTTTNTTGTTGGAATAAAGQLLQADRFIGTDVAGTGGDAIGNVEDLLVNLDAGQVLYLVVSYGGFLGLGGNSVPVPFEAAPISTGENGRNQVTLDIDAQTLDTAPQLDMGSLPENTTAGWDASVRSFWQQHGLE